MGWSPCYVVSILHVCAVALRVCVYVLFLKQRVNDGDVSSLLQTPNWRLTLRINTTSCSGGRGFLPCGLIDSYEVQLWVCPEFDQEGAGRVDRFPSPPPS